MQKIFGSFVALLALFVFNVSALAAEAITAAQAGQFVSAIPQIEAFSTKLEQSGKNKILEDAVKPKPGETQLSPYTKGVAVMKAQLPEEYNELGTIVTAHGFPSQEGWAVVGDNVMQSYMAIKMEGQNQEAVKAMAAMTPEQKAGLPPQAQAQIEQAVNMMKLLETVPSGNKEAVRPHIASIDQWLQEAAKKNAPQPATAAPQGSTAPAPAQ